MQSATGSQAEPIGRHDRDDGQTGQPCAPLRSAVADAAPPSVSGAGAQAGWANGLKRAVDLVAAVLLLVITAPLSLLVMILIKLEDGGPVLFGQRRVGRHGAVFTLRKFRSMRVDAEARTGPVWAQANDPRVTRIGSWMRPFGIDEIPQAWNVLCGEMSFVGPRPERPEFVAQLETAIPCYAERHRVRPGITGWAQVTLPYGSTLDDARDKLDRDLYYVQHADLGLDLVIMARTIWHTARRRR